MNSLSTYLAEAAKFLTAAVTALGVILSTGLLHGTAQTALTSAIAAGGAVLVYLVPNATPHPSTAGPPHV